MLLEFGGILSQCDTGLAWDVLDGPLVFRWANQFFLLDDMPA